MNIEEEVFLKYIENKEKLNNYGFELIGNEYIYKVKIMDESFLLEVHIKSSKVSIRVIDLNMDEEYVNYRNEKFNGSYVGMVRDNIEKELVKIRDNCFERISYISPQTSRILNLIEDRFNVEREYPFKDECIIYRKNKKWFFLLMQIPLLKLTKNDKDTRMIEVINLKLDDEVSRLINTLGIYECYHMSKKKWISVLIDDVLSDEQVFELINKSYNNVK